MAKEKKGTWRNPPHSSRSKSGKTTKARDLHYTIEGSWYDKNKLNKNKDQSRLEARGPAKDMNSKREIEINKLKQKMGAKSINSIRELKPR